MKVQNMDVISVTLATGEERMMEKHKRERHEKAGSCK
jgi:hypothetical protein